MDNDGKLPAKDKSTYPRPLGGPEPSAQGDTRNIPDSNTAFQPKGYDYSSSLEGASMADMKRGYRQGEKIDAGSDAGDSSMR